MAGELTAPEPYKAPAKTRARDVLRTLFARMDIRRVYDEQVWRCSTLHN